jgi:hypothetical protein
VPEDMQAVLLGIVYGDDERITPADRVRAAELLERTGEAEPTVRGVLRSMPDAEVAGEWDAYFAGELRGLLVGRSDEMARTAEACARWWRRGRRSGRARWPMPIGSSARSRSGPTAARRSCTASAASSS